jgi:hypothetical protein
MKIQSESIDRWAEAIALRISDEWDGNKLDNKEDVDLLRQTLENVFKNNPSQCRKLIGTTIIEEDYFDEIT